MGRTVETHADLAIVTNDNPRLEDPQAIAAESWPGFAAPSEARWIPDRVEAIHYALSLAGPDDSVLVAGRGHETASARRLRTRIPLDDREVVAAALVQPGTRVAIRRADERGQIHRRSRLCVS